jgi:hypothetical protein
MKDRLPGAETDGPHADDGAHADEQHLRADDIRQQLGRIVGSSPFRDAFRLTSFLSFIVEMTLAGNCAKLKAYTIAVEALGRGADFDPQADPIVRVEAVRMRQALARYYSGPGRDDPLVIEVPRGSYVPAFLYRNALEKPTLRAGEPLPDHAKSEVKSDVRSEVKAGQQPAAEFATERRTLAESIRRFRELAKAHRQQVAAMAAAVGQARQTLLDSRALLQAYRSLDLACGADRPLLPTAQPYQPNELRPADGRQTQRQQAQGAAAARIRRPRAN